MTCGFQTVSSPHEVFCWLTVNCGVFNFNIIGFLSNGRRIGAWNMVGQISSRPLMFFWPPKGSVLEGKSPLFQGNQSWCDIIIWPEFFFPNRCLPNRLFPKYHPIDKTSFSDIFRDCTDLLVYFHVVLFEGTPIDT